MKVYIILVRGEELPDSAFSTKEAAELRRKALGSEEDYTVHEMTVDEKQA